jgi:hypothetical protein
MKNLLTTPALLACLAFATPAFAQVTVRDHRGAAPAQGVHRVPSQAPMMRADFAPKAGTVGTLVTIDGRGFSRNTTVLVGGVAVKPRAISATQITFAIPARHGNGLIALRTGRAERALGTFEVLPTLRVQSFAPSAGPPGTRVVIHGAGFRHDDRVLIGGVEARVESRTATRLVALVPARAQTGKLSVVRFTGQTVLSSATFRALPPRPVVQAIFPAQARPGETVRLTGMHLGPDVNVYYGSTRLRIVNRDHRGLEVALPAGARKTEPFYVQSASHGKTRLNLSFQLVLPPVIQSWSATSAAPGATITLRGQHFSPETRIYIGNTLALDVKVDRTGRVLTFVMPRLRPGSYGVWLESDGARLRAPRDLAVTIDRRDHRRRG